VAIGLTDNNPGDILAGTGAFQGITGSVSANGLTYDVFQSAAYGIRALAIDIKNAVNEGYNTVSSFVYHYLGTSSNNAANPNVANYLAAVVQGSGLSANSPITSANVPQLVQGVLQGEGTLSGTNPSDISSGLQLAGFTGATGVTGVNMTPAQSAVASTGGGFFNALGAGTNELFTNPGEFFNIYGQVLGNGISTIVGNPAGTAAGAIGNFNAGAATIGQAASDTGSQVSAGITQAAASITNAVKPIGNFFTDLTSGSILTRTVLVIVGVLLLAAAIFAFTKQNPVNVVANAAMA